MPWSLPALTAKAFRMKRPFAALFSAAARNSTLSSCSLSFPSHKRKWTLSSPLPVHPFPLPSSSLATNRRPCCPLVFVHARARLKHSTAWHDTRLADVFIFRNGDGIQMRAFADRRQALEWAGVKGSEANGPNNRCLAELALLDHT